MTRATEPSSIHPGYAVRLAASLPKLDRNGLARDAEDLLRNPRKLRLIVAVCDVARVIDDIDTGSETAVVRLLRIETVDGQKAPKAWLALLDDAREDTLPIDADLAGEDL